MIFCATLLDNGLLILEKMVIMLKVYSNEDRQRTTFNQKNNNLVGYMSTVRSISISVDFHSAYPTPCHHAYSKA